MRRWFRLGFGGVALAVGPDLVVAHEVGASRFDAPLPLPALFAGAGLTVVVTAGLLAATGTDRLLAVGPRPTLTLSPAWARRLRPTARLLFLVAFVGALVAGAVGRQVRAENVATVFVWPVWLTGVGFLAALFGSPWRVLSPWRTIYAGLVRLEGDELAALGEYPERLGAWPALFGFLGWLGVLANLTVVPRSPRATTLVVAGYAAVMVLGAVAFGPTWLRRADALAVLYRLFGRVAPFPLSRTDDGGYVLVVRPPWQGCTAPVADGVVAAFVVAAVYTVSFDGFTNTPEFQTLLFAVRDALGAGPDVAAPLYLAGAVAFVVAFWLVAGVAEQAADEADWQGAVRAFAPTVLPIAVAYDVAHYYPWVLRNLGQFVTVLVGYVATATPTVEPLGWLSLGLFWTSQVALVVGGHVIAVIAAHHVATRRYESQRRAARAHLPFTLLMVGYTVLSLWIVSRPVVS